MQIYLFQNGQQEGPFGLPRIVARLVSGELDSATPAWREGLDNWYPLHHDIWKEAGINAPEPKAQSAPPEEASPEPEPEQDVVTEPDPETVQEPTLPEQPAEPDSQSEEGDQAGEEEPASEEPGPEPEQTGAPFANYREHDFEPPSYEQMEEEMSELRVKREKFPELIGKQALESDIRDEEIEEARAQVEEVTQGKKESELPAAWAELGRAVMAAGITDPALNELREEEQDVSDRMLNLQMQLRRMGGGNRVKQPSAWRKWIILLIVALLMGGLVTSLVLFGEN
mgnify:FL=1